MDLFSVTLPTGGKVQYEYDEEDVPIPGSDPLEFETIRTLHERWMYDRGSSLPMGDPWVIQMDWGPGDTFSGGTTITTPSGRSIAYIHFGTDAEGRSLEGGVGLRQRIIRNAAGVEVEREELTYVDLPVAQVEFGALPVYTQEVESRTITRTEANGSREYETTYTFGGAPAQYHDYHRPTLVEERVAGTLARSTSRDYTHLETFDVGGTLFVVGLPTEETVTVDGSTVTREWSYYPGSGFRGTETTFHSPGASGITTTFTPDERGNLATVTKANRTATSFTYRYGQVRTTTTAAHTSSREINLDGTVFSETRNGRTTLFAYDDLGRVTRTTPPGPVNPIDTAYDNNTGATVTTTRGSSTVTTTLDGFGRPVATLNSAGVRTSTTYDQEGRKTFESLPFEGGGMPPGVTFTYDALDRVVRETNGDGTYRERSYGVDTITVRDEEARLTTYTRRAFGHPDDARLIGVHDAANNDWTYTYTVTGALAGVLGPNGVTRSWTYSPQQLVASETHPESGTVTFTYDPAGLLATKADANQTTFVYDYDANDRLERITAGGKVTTFTYEPGSDNRRSAQVDGQLTEFNYDSAGRMDFRRDTLDGIVFTTRYEYDANDNVELIVYPTNRRVAYAYDAENRLTRVSACRPRPTTRTSSPTILRVR